MYRHTRSNKTDGIEMVEGPGCTRNGVKARAAIGLWVISASIPSKSSPILEGRQLIDVLTVGKELFLIFSKRSEEQRIDDNPDDIKDIALRVHFGMNGCLYIDDGDVKYPKFRVGEEKRSHRSQYN